MSHRERGTKEATAVIALLLLTSAVCCNGILGLDIIDDPGALSDGAMGGMPGPEDGGVDATQWDATVDASTTSDATSDGANVDSAAIDDGPLDATDNSVDCAALLAQVVFDPIRPPYGWFGLDLSNGTGGSGGDSGAAAGLSIDRVLACAISAEPEELEAGTSPWVPGAREVEFTSLHATVSSAGSHGLFYNLGSGIIWYAEATFPARTVLEFHARVGGMYDDGGPDGGPSIYVIDLGSSSENITRNGYAFPGNWSWPIEDAGELSARVWANEIYDGLIATYAPSLKAVSDCLEEPFVRVGFEPQRVSACSFEGKSGTDGVQFVVQPLALGLECPFGSSQVLRIDEYFPGGSPSCATPQAARERMDYSPIQVFGNASPLLGPVWAGTQVAYLTPAEPLASDAGMLATEADNLAGCDGVSAAAPDPGYAAEQWGDGEVELEYNPDSGVAYKLFVREGYQGQLTVSALVDDGGSLMSYAVGIGVLTADMVPVTLDWSNADGALNATITALSNGWFSSAGCSFVDSDCVQQGDCAIVSDDLDGHSTFTFAMSPAHAASCADPHPITFVFDQGASVPSEIYVTNPGGAL